MTINALKLIILKNKRNMIEKYSQDNRNNSQKLSIACKLFAIVHLLPPGQSIVDALVFSKGSPLLPMEEVISYLRQKIQTK